MELLSEYNIYGFKNCWNIVKQVSTVLEIIFEVYLKI